MVHTLLCRRKTARCQWLLATTGLAALLVWNTSAAFAQEATPPATETTPPAAAPATETASDQAGGLAEIVVTARKRNESAQDVPVAVTALSSEELVNRNIRTIEQIATSTPQFVVARGSSGSGANLSLRGIGSNFTSIGIEQSVSINVDGVYYGQGRVLNEGLFDMRQVEILKGPQALFFGKNATAGALSFITANPGPDLELLGRVGYEFRTHEKYAEGVISGPITDTIGARLAVRVTDMDQGYMRNQSTGGPFSVTDTATAGTRTTYNGPPSTKYGPMDQNFNVRGTLSYEPTDQFSVILKGSYSDREATTEKQRLQASSTSCSSVRSGAPRSSTRATNVARTGKAIGTTFRLN